MTWAPSGVLIVRRMVAVLLLLVVVQVLALPVQVLVQVLVLALALPQAVQVLFATQGGSCVCAPPSCTRWDTASASTTARTSTASCRAAPR